jgi:hypothetical protein
MPIPINLDGSICLDEVYKLVLKIYVHLNHQASMPQSTQCKRSLAVSCIWMPIPVARRLVPLMIIQMIHNNNMIHTVSWVIWVIWCLLQGINCLPSAAKTVYMKNYSLSIPMDIERWLYFGLVEISAKISSSHWMKG